MAYPYQPYYPQQYFPQNYQAQQSIPQMQQIPQQPVQQTQQPQQNQQQIQNGGFMVIPSEEMARTYPVAPGNCVTFKIEGKPIVMEKSMGFSQLEAPRIDRYRLVREEDVVESQEQPEKQNDYLQIIDDLREQFTQDLNSVRGEIDAIKSQISKPTTTKKKDSGGN